MTRQITKIYVHCSATKPSQAVTTETIRRWHLDRGWRDLGYHWVIERDGSVHEGRPESQSGAHVKGDNAHSIGICMVGGVNEDNQPDANFTIQQYIELGNLLSDKITQYGLTRHDVYGHRDVSSKACPSFDIHALIENNA